MIRPLGRIFLALAFVTPLAMFSQEFRAAISGNVTDPSGAGIAGAKITVTESRTSTKNQAVADSSGKFNVLFLLTGDYDIAVSGPGFKDYVRKAMHLGAGDHPVIDVPLQLGEAAQTVEVTADVPLVNSENSSVGQAITTKEVEDMPVNGRSALTLAQLAIGVIPSPFNSTSTVQQPYDSANNFSLGGTPTQTSEMLLDGSPNATWDNRSAYTPPIDAVQEVRVKAFDTDAAFGHTGGGTINMVMKTGTNSIHGTAYEFNQPTMLTANNFFNNRNGLGNPATHFNQYGLTVGGPVLHAQGNQRQGQAVLVLFLGKRRQQPAQYGVHERAHGRREDRRFLANPQDRRHAALRSVQRRNERQHHHAHPVRE